LISDDSYPGKSFMYAFLLNFELGMNISLDLSFHICNAALREWLTMWLMAN